MAIEQLPENVVVSKLDEPGQLVPQEQPVAHAVSPRRAVVLS